MNLRQRKKKYIIGKPDFFSVRFPFIYEIEVKTRRLVWNLRSKILWK